MYDVLVIGIFVVLVLVVIGSIIGRIFGLLFKIALFLLIIMIIFGGIFYVDLYRSNVIGETALVFVDDNELFGYTISNGTIGEPLNETTLALWDYEDIKETEEADLGNFTLLIFVEGQYEESFIESLSGKFKRYIDLFKIFKNDDLYFYPKTLTLRAIEKIRG